jgi:hypothetical protein
LRQHALLAADNESRLWDLLLRSAPSFSTLFRHALVALGEQNGTNRREAVKALGQRAGFDPSAILQVLDVREHKADRKKINVSDLAARYLALVEKVTAVVDTASGTPGKA